MASPFANKRAKDSDPIIQPVAQPSGQHFGGSFAPPLSDETIAEYKALIDAMPVGPVKDSMTILMNCCGVWWELPEPEGTEKRAHPSGTGTIVHLQSDHAKTLDEHIPWAHELKAIQDLFDKLPTGIAGEEFHEGKRRNIVVDPAAKKVRDAAFHLLWHVIELDKGREPMTKDKL